MPQSSCCAVGQPGAKPLLEMSKAQGRPGIGDVCWFLYTNGVHGGDRV